MIPLRTRRRAVLVAVLIFSAGPLLAQVDTSVAARAALESIPLFASHEFLSLTVEAPLETIFKERDQESEEYPGVVKVARADGDTAAHHVEIRTRGKSRLTRRICEFPPLRLDFDRDSVAGTVFEGQDKLKLVVHCDDDREEYEQYVLLEYLAYRTYNLLTEYSFRVRPARITYIDTDAKRDSLTRFAFLIEDDEMVAARTGEMLLEGPMVPPALVDRGTLALMEVFQYFIGNTDYSAFAAEPGKEECCHNTQPIGDHVGPVYPLPYDFDLSGLVNTRYANRLFRENLERMGMRRVRDRLFRGMCEFVDGLPAALARFNEKRDEIYALFHGLDELDPEVLEDTIEYIDEFYEIINDEGKRRREFHGNCRR